MSNEYSLMSIPDAALIISKLSKESGRKAGQELEAFAHVRGDKDTKLVIKETNPFVLATILSSHDYTVPSIASWLMDAESILNSIEMQPATWESEIIQNVESASAAAFDFFTYIFGLADDKRQLAAVIDGMTSSDSHRIFLLLAFLTWDRNKDVDPAPGNHLYLYQLIESFSPELAEMLDDYGHYNPIDDGEDQIKWQRIYRTMLNSVVHTAKARVIGLDDGELDDMFTPIK